MKVRPGEQVQYSGRQCKCLLKSWDTITGICIEYGRHGHDAIPDQFAHSRHDEQVVWPDPDTESMMCTKASSSGAGDDTLSIGGNGIKMIESHNQMELKDLNSETYVQLFHNDGVVQVEAVLTDDPAVYLNNDDA